MQSKVKKLIVHPDDGMINEFRQTPGEAIPFPLAPRTTKEQLRSVTTLPEKKAKIPVSSETLRSEPGQTALDGYPSLLLRYRDVPDYPEGSYAPRDFDYHNIMSCGPRGTGSINDAFRANGIICDFDDYSQYGPSYLAEPEVKSQITSARKKACRCEVERKLTNENMHHIQSMDEIGDHIYPLRRAIAMCKQCAQIERDLYRYGYLKNKKEIEKDDAIVRLMLEVYSLYKSGEQLWKHHDGVTRFDKILKFLWMEYLPSDAVLKNIKKAMTFNEFKKSFGAVDIYVEEMLLRAELQKALLNKRKGISKAEAKRRRLSSINDILNLKKTERNRASRSKQMKVSRQTSN